MQRSREQTRREREREFEHRSRSAREIRPAQRSAVTAALLRHRQRAQVKIQEMNGRSRTVTRNTRRADTRRVEPTPKTIKPAEEPATKLATPTRFEARAPRQRHVVRRGSSGSTGPLEKPCKALVERMASFLKNTFKATVNNRGQTFGPKVDLELLRERMPLRLPLVALEKLLKGPHNEESIVKVGDHYYSNLKQREVQKRLREADLVEQEALKDEAMKKQRKLEKERQDLEQKAKGMVTEEDLQALKDEENALQDLAAKKAEAEVLKKDLEEKKARIETLTKLPKPREADQEELEQLKQEVTAFQARLEALQSTPAEEEAAEAEEGEGSDEGPREVDATSVDQDKEAQAEPEVAEEGDAEGEAEGAAN